MALGQIWFLISNLLLFFHLPRVAGTAWENWPRSAPGGPATSGTNQPYGTLAALMFATLSRGGHVLDEELGTATKEDGLPEHRAWRKHVIFPFCQWAGRWISYRESYNVKTCLQLDRLQNQCGINGKVVPLVQDTLSISASTSIGTARLSLSPSVSPHTVAGQVKAWRGE